MTDKPILFSAHMIRALLAGTKTQTRRTSGLADVNENPDAWSLHNVGPLGYMAKPSAKGKFGATFESRQMEPGALHVCPQRLPIAPGDRLFPAMPIPSLNRNYCADLYGRIWSRARDGEAWKTLKGSATSKGYLSVTPAHEGRYRTRPIHRLIAETYYGHEPGGMKQVRHLSGDQTDNAPENLDWGTQEDNWSDRYAHGRYNGERHHSSKLTIADVEEIRASKSSQRSLAARFGVTQSTIWAVRAARVWQDSPQPNPPNCPRWASRLTLTVTDVRVQRLQEITYPDTRAEGIETTDIWQRRQTACLERNEECGSVCKDSFRELWNSIHGPDAWSLNPWVACYSFSVHRCNIDQMGR